MKEIKYVIFISSSGSGTVINYGSGSGSDFLTSYGSGYGSGSTSQKVTVPTVPVPVPVPQHRLQALLTDVVLPAGAEDDRAGQQPVPGGALSQAAPGSAH